MDGDAVNAATAGPDALQGVVRHTDGSVACLSRRAQQQGESLVRAVCKMAVGLRCWRACKTAQSWASRMAHPRASRELGFLAGSRARRLEDAGIVASSLNEGGAMHGSDKRVLVRHYLGQGVVQRD